MDTTINRNMGGNNSMNSLSFFWIALFSDNTKIEQFENGTEHKFQEIKDKINELAYFNLTDKKGHFFTVDLINGRIGYNYLPMPYLEKSNKDNIRLIFFRRYKEVFDIKDLQQKSHTITYHLGFQYNDKLGINRQIVLEIDSEGNWIVGE